MMSRHKNCVSIVANWATMNTNKGDWQINKGQKQIHINNATHIWEP